ncbi:hypothetical protein Bbelb_061040 [Branchiostoma belcheri]|nr:hypothetical protein Bbelb_061040 [Branchiostoma belcheri]
MVHPERGETTDTRRGASRRVEMVFGSIVLLVYVPLFIRVLSASASTDDGRMLLPWAEKNATLVLNVTRIGAYEATLTWAAPQTRLNLTDVTYRLSVDYRHYRHEAWKHIRDLSFAEKTSSHLLKDLESHSWYQGHDREKDIVMVRASMIPYVQKNRCPCQDRNKVQRKQSKKQKKPAPSGILAVILTTPTRGSNCKGSTEDTQKGQQGQGQLQGGKQLDRLADVGSRGHGFDPWHSWTRSRVVRIRDSSGKNCRSCVDRMGTAQNLKVLGSNPRQASRVVRVRDSYGKKLQEVNSMDRLADTGSRCHGFDPRHSWRDIVSSEDTWQGCQDQGQLREKL